ncbi:MAG: lysoplasmalogenase [Flavobacterium sp.]|nr:MAG: lysoplasmalogenase [Flavobacterium sp.]
MLRKYLEFSIAFAFIFIIQLVIQAFPVDSNTFLGNFEYIFKPLIVISLMAFYFHQTKLKGRFATRIFFGLFFGLIGDVLLMFVHVNANYFMFGLVAFLIGHFLYITAFYLDYNWNPAIEKTATRWALLIFGVFCLGFYMLLRPHLGEMKIPVMVYAFTISLMGIMAVNRKGRVGSLSYKLILIGAVLFIASDGVLAYNKFVQNFKFAGVAIMATYMLAQYLIVVGSVERKLKKSVGRK